MEAAAAHSHQLRTPAAVVTGLADNMVQGALGHSKRVIEYGELLREHGQRLNEIVDRTLRMTSLHSGTRGARGSIDVSEVAKAALEEAQPLIDSAGFEAEHAFAEGLRQSLGDLLDNAVKYGLPGRWVKIETCAGDSRRKREVRIRVHDRGRGIPAGEARKIFEPYYRVAEVANSSIPGSGLGLALVRDAVESMGGRLTLESVEDQGSVFTIHLRA